MEIKGVIVPLITPMDESERLKITALRALIDFLIQRGVHGVFVLGSTGEFFALDYEEKVKAVAVTMEHVNGRVPVYVGASAITTKECVKLTRLAKQYGAAATSVLTPMFISPSEEELYNHFRTIAEAEDIPNILYNNPARTGINMSANLIERLSDIPNIVGVKDSSGDMTLTSEYIRRTRGKDFCVLAGRDTMILATLVYGGTGCVASTANVVPEVVVEIYEKFVAGDLAGALDAQYRLAPLRIAFNLGCFPAVPKEALNLLGVDVGPPIKPVERVSGANREKLREILVNMGVLKSEQEEDA